MEKLEVILEWFNRILWTAILLGCWRIEAMLKKLNEKWEVEGT